jgi:hypothetical protein
VGGGLKGELPGGLGARAAKKSGHSRFRRAAGWGEGGGDACIWTSNHRWSIISCRRACQMVCTVSPLFLRSACFYLCLEAPVLVLALV